MKPEEFDFEPSVEAPSAGNGEAFSDSQGFAALDFLDSPSEEDDSAPVWEEAEHDFFSADEKTFESSISFLGSLIFHLLLLLLMVLWPIIVPQGRGKLAKISAEFVTSDETDELEDLADESGVVVEADSGDTASEKTLETETLLPEETMVEVETEPTESEVEDPTELDTQNATEDATEDPAKELLEALNEESTSPVDPNEVGSETLPSRWTPETTRPSGGETDWNQQVAAPRSLPASGGMGPRTDEAARGQMLEEAGGNAQSEDAVERGLAWIARHQQFDSRQKYYGSWSFSPSSAENSFSNSGEATSRVAATSLALLALLGHGNTREKGPYQKAVQEGLYFLSTKAKARSTMPGYDFRDSPDSHGMYGHIFATLALCEAYALEENKDPNLKQLAYGGLQWILYAQDSEGGGWRYQPHEAGDISITAWVVMLLKSAQMCGFEIPSQTIIKMDRFLDSVSVDQKAQYSYQPQRSAIPSTTAMGLCARVFSGTKRDADFLRRGTRFLAEECGCSKTDVYYNYYGTLLLRHYGGPLWRTWNEEMRDYLVRTQEQSGRDSGSWYFEEPTKANNQIGGRLYTTVMSVMILEVYYRFLPIYQEQSATGL